MQRQIADRTPSDGPTPSSLRFGGFWTMSCQDDHLPVSQQSAAAREIRFVKIDD